jgi:hypothetical protein
MRRWRSSDPWPNSNVAVTAKQHQRIDMFIIAAWLRERIG